MKTGRFYIGQTQDLLNRVQDHNMGRSTYTAKHGPWNLVWYSIMQSRSEAYKEEQRLKKLKSRDRVIRFIHENPCLGGSENLQISDLLDFGESTQE